mgnify:CR=1 FL=1
MKALLISQYQASLCTLAHCVARCPEELWHTHVAKYPFCQSAFHTLLFADYYLEPDPETMRQQPFHQENPKLFDDYEQLLDREPVSLYERTQIEEYANFCRFKAVRAISAETEESFAAPSKVTRRKCSRAEVHVYNIRHIQHHAAQLILRLRLDTKIDIPWIGSGWIDPH